MTVNLRMLRGLIRAQADEIASYEWAAGIVLCNVTHEELQRTLARGLQHVDDGDRTMATALTHEALHFVQACLSPPLLLWSRQWNDLVWELLLAAQDGSDTATAVRLLHDPRWVDPDLASRAREHLDVLTRPYPPWGLSARPAGGGGLLRRDERPRL